MKLVRTLHRWIAIGASVFLLNLFVTGTILAWGSIADARREAAPASTAFLPQDQLHALLQAVYQTARDAAPTAPIMAVRLSMGNGEPRGAATIGGPDSGMLFIDPVRHGYLIGPAGSNTPGNAAMDSHSFLKRLHRGDVIGGISGRYLMIAAGFCLLFLLLSSIVMYAQMRGQRARSGRHDWVWR